MTHHRKSRMRLWVAYLALILAWSLASLPVWAMPSQDRGEEEVAWDLGPGLWSWLEGLWPSSDLRSAAGSTDNGGPFKPVETDGSGPEAESFATQPDPGDTTAEAGAKINIDG